MFQASKQSQTPSRSTVPALLVYSREPVLHRPVSHQRVSFLDGFPDSGFSVTEIAAHQAAWSEELSTFTSPFVSIARTTLTSLKSVSFAVLKILVCRTATSRVRQSMLIAAMIPSKFFSLETSFNRIYFEFGRTNLQLLVGLSFVVESSRGEPRKNMNSHYKVPSLGTREN